MLSNVTKFDSDISSELEFIRGLKRRSLEQKFIYTDHNARHYYYCENLSTTTEDITTEEYFSFIHERIPDKKKVLFVGMGCGDSSKEKPLLEALISVGKDIHYMAVDSSTEMLNLSFDTLKHSTIRYQLVNADITSSTFTEEINKIVAQYDFVVFGLLGSTICNMVQTEVVDSLYNMCIPNGIILLDIPIRPRNEQVDKLRLFKHYAKYLTLSHKMEFCFHPLHKIGVPFQNGKMELHTFTEESVGVETFRFVFRFYEVTKVNIDEQTLHFIPPEYVTLLDTRNYYAPQFLSFFNNHKLATVKEYYRDSSGLFMFSKIR